MSRPSTLKRKAGFRCCVAVTEGLMAAKRQSHHTAQLGRAGAFMGRNLDGFPFRS